MMRDKRVLITGGAGFIGSCLSIALSPHNDVTILDNLSTGSLRNIADLLEAHKVKLAKNNLADIPFLNGILKDVDYVFHQAAIPSVPRSISDPASTNDAGITGTLNLLVAARDSDIKKFVFASSCAVYGDAQTLPLSESLPVSPLSPYALTKLAGEHYCRLFTELYGLPTVCLRYFNVYGPRQDPQSEYAAVIPKFITRALSGEKLVIYGDGTQTRDFVYVRDVVRANILAAASGATGVYNIASGVRTSINDLAREVFSATGRNTGIEYAPPRPGDVLHSVADITRAKNDLGYVPEYSLREGLEETVKWFQSKDTTGS